MATKLIADMLLWELNKADTALRAQLARQETLKLTLAAAQARVQEIQDEAERQGVVFVHDPVRGCYFIDPPTKGWDQTTP